MATWTKEVVDLSVAGSALTIDNVKIDGTNIGHTDDTDLLALASGALTVNGTIATTGNATIGGDLTITGGDLTLGSVNYLSDSSGTGTLKNIDALDATTEATIEAAMDTLPNVTSVGTLSTLTVDNVIVNGTTIGHTSDTDLMTLASGALTLKGTLTVGIDDAGHDVKFFGDTASNYMLWDTSEDGLAIHTTNTSKPGLKITKDGARTVSDSPDIHFHKNSIPNDDDYLASLKFLSEKSDGAGGTTTINYGEIDTFCRDNTTGAEDGSMIFSVIAHGTLSQGLKVKAVDDDSNADVKVEVTDGLLQIGVNDTKTGTIELWDGNGSDAPGYILFRQPNGQAKYVWVNNSGDLMIHTSAPTTSNTSDGTDGTVIGTQS